MWWRAKDYNLIIKNEKKGILNTFQKKEVKGEIKICLEEKAKWIRKNSQERHNGSRDIKRQFGMLFH